MQEKVRYMWLISDYFEKRNYIISAQLQANNTVEASAAYRRSVSHIIQETEGSALLYMDMLRDANTRLVKARIRQKELGTGYSFIKYLGEIIRR